MTVIHLVSFICSFFRDLGMCSQKTFKFIYRVSRDFCVHTQYPAVLFCNSCNFIPIFSALFRFAFLSSELAPLFPKYPPNIPPMMEPNTGIGIKNCPIMAPDKAEPTEVPVEMTNREMGAIYLYGVFCYKLFQRAFSPKPPRLKKSLNIGIY